MAPRAIIAWPLLVSCLLILIVVFVQPPTNPPDLLKLPDVVRHQEQLLSQVVKELRKVQEQQDGSLTADDDTPRLTDTHYQPGLDTAHGRLVSSSGVRVRVVVLVGSTARSGTSLVGELLAQQYPRLYLFEPELYIAQVTKNKVGKTDALSVLRDMIHCHYSTNFVRWLHTRSGADNIVRTKFTRDCHKFLCLSPANLTADCVTHHTRIMKVIRVRMRWMTALLDDPELDLKVIHLVRDPRGSLKSMKEHRLHKLDPEYFCPRVEDDLRSTQTLMLRYPGRVSSLRYERFCLDPFGEALKLWQFVSGEDTPLPPEWSTYITQHMFKQPSHIKTYSTKRKAEVQYQAWRQQVSQEVLSRVEGSCSSVIKLLGHNIFGHVDYAKNLSIALFAA